MLQQYFTQVAVEEEVEEYEEEYDPAQEGVMEVVEEVQQPKDEDRGNHKIRLIKEVLSDCGVCCCNRVDHVGPDRRGGKSGRSGDRQGGDSGRGRGWRHLGGGGVSRRRGHSSRGR